MKVSDPRNLTMLCDFYELTMGNGYFAAGYSERICYFDVFYRPDATWKTKTVYNFEAKELLVPIFQNGKLVYDLPDLEQIRNYCAQQVDTLWDEVKRFDYPHNYYVDLSQKLWDIKYGLLKKGSRKV